MVSWEDGNRIFRQVLLSRNFVAFEVTIEEAAAARTALDGAGGGARFPARSLSVRPSVGGRRRPPQPQWPHSLPPGDLV